MTQKLAANFDLDKLLAEVLETGMELLEAEMGALWLYDPDTRELVTLLPQLETPLRVAEGEGLSGICAAERRIINVLDAAIDPRFRGSIDRAVGFTTRSMLNVPLIARDGALIGVIFDPAGHRWREPLRRAAGIVAGELARLGYFGPVCTDVSGAVRWTSVSPGKSRASPSMVFAYWSKRAST